jgi:hypothetical protein
MVETGLPPLRWHSPGPAVGIEFAHQSCGDETGALAYPQSAPDSSVGSTAWLPPRVSNEQARIKRPSRSTISYRNIHREHAAGTLDDAAGLSPMSTGRCERALDAFVRETTL